MDVYLIWLDVADCFAYARATERGGSLLYKGDDFGPTDMGNALTDG